VLIFQGTLQYEKLVQCYLMMAVPRVLGFHWVVKSYSLIY